MGRGKSLGSFFSACGSPTLWRDYPLLVLDTLLRGQLTSDAWVYFRAPLFLSTGLSAFMPFPYCLAYYSFEYILKSESVIMPSDFFLMFKITLANFFFCVWFPMNLRISYFCKKNAIGVFARITSNLELAFGTPKIFFQFTNMECLFICRCLL